MLKGTGHSDDGSLRQLSITFNCDMIDPDEISEYAFELGCSSVSVEVSDEKPVAVDEQKWSDMVRTASWANAVLRMNIVASFDENKLIQLLKEAYPESDLNVQRDIVQPRDWVACVQRTWRPQVIGNLTVSFPWHQNETIHTSHSLTLEGGSSFGTGEHPTTRLCCSWLEKNLAIPGPPLSVLDYGCGSAILALAALKFGASSAAGVDIDRDALSSAKSNAIRNNLHIDLFEAAQNEDVVMEGNELYSAETFETQADAEKFPPVSAMNGVQFDLIAANILAPVLIALAPTIAAHTKPHGQVALAGIVSSQAKAVKSGFEKYFSTVEVIGHEDDWVLIEASGRLP